MITSKSYFAEYVVKMLGEEKPLRILDMGSGTSRNFLDVIKAYPHITYVGVEPNEYAARVAQESLRECANAHIYTQLGYQNIPGVDRESFDLVISLSVLEHVKHLEQFITTSVEYAKNDGLIIHRYDLGHSLAPSSIKEKVQVYLGGNFPWVLNEKNFVRYVAESEVQSCLKKAGVREILPTTFHQMPSHKLFEKVASQAYFNESKKALFEWELKYADTIRTLTPSLRESVFHSVAVWARK